MFDTPYDGGDQSDNFRRAIHRFHVPRCGPIGLRGEGERDKERREKAGSMTVVVRDD